MDLSKKSEEQLEGNFKIVDTISVLVLLATGVLLYFVVVAFIMDKALFEIIIGSVLLLPISSALMYRFFAIQNGIEFDLKTRKLSFPGGGLAANEILDYVRPAYFMQYLKRITIDLDDIQKISTRVEWTSTIESTFGFGSGKSKKNKGRRLIKILTVSGNFGTADIKFKSDVKCDQVFTSLSYHLNMGSPVIVRS